MPALRTPLRLLLRVQVTPNRGDVDLYVSNLTTRNPQTGRPMPLFPQVLCTMYSYGQCVSWGADPSALEDGGVEVVVGAQ